MIIKIFVGSVILAAALGTSSVAQSQRASPTSPALGSWEALMYVPYNDRLIVELRDNSVVRGRMHGSDASVLVVTRERRQIIIARENIRRIFLVNGRGTGSMALGGACVGANVGGGVVAVARGVGGDPEEPEATVASAAVIGIMSGVGAGVGVMTRPFRRPRRRLIYEAR